MELKKYMKFQDKIIALRREIKNAGKSMGKNALTMYKREFTGRFEFLLQKDILKLIDKLFPKIK